MIVAIRRCDKCAKEIAPSTPYFVASVAFAKADDKIIGMSASRVTSEAKLEHQDFEVCSPGCATAYVQTLLELATR